LSKVLVVEDDSAILETLSIFLAMEGYEMERATSVREARARLDQMRPDLVLLDYMLQDDTAEPVVQHLWERHGRGIPVILLTAAENPQEKRESAGASMVISKPFDLDILLSHMKRALDSAKVPKCSPAVIRPAESAGPSLAL